MSDSAPLSSSSSGPVLLARLERLAGLMTARVEQLEARLLQGEEAAWPAFLETVKVLAAVMPLLAPERRGALLTTQEMAVRLNLSPKTLLRRKARGEIRPVLQLGRRGKAAFRWRGDEVSR